MQVGALSMRLVLAKLAFINITVQLDKAPFATDSVINKLTFISADTMVFYFTMSVAKVSAPLARVASTLFNSLPWSLLKLDT